MKKTIIFTLLGLSAYTVSGQINNIFPTTGKVGIGTNNPQALLDIVKPAEQNMLEVLTQYSMSDAPGQNLKIINGTNYNGYFLPYIMATRNKSDDYALGISGAVTDATVDVGDKPLLRFEARRLTGPALVRPLFSWGSYDNDYMIMTANGNLGIGTNKPLAKLSVNGNILATEIKIKTNIEVPDYVFDPNYQLPKLTTIENYVKKYRHLPEIPSAAEIQKEGIDLTQMNLALLKKVEELTLHLIEKEKEIEKLKINQEAGFLELSKRLDRMEK